MQAPNPLASTGAPMSKQRSHLRLQPGGRLEDAQLANHLPLFKASLDWLRDGRVEGKSEGALRLGFR